VTVFQLGDELVHQLLCCYLCCV